MLPWFRCIRHDPKQFSSGHVQSSFFLSSGEKTFSPSSPERLSFLCPLGDASPNNTHPQQLEDRRDEFIDVDPAEFVPVLKRDPNALTRRPFTLPELRRVLEIADQEWQSLILFGLYTGQRLGDLAALTWANVDLARSELHFITRKRGKPLTIPLATPLRDHILNHLTGNDAPDAPVHPRAFATLKKDKRVRHLSAQFGDLLAAAGLRSKLPHQSRGIGRDVRRGTLDLSFHCLRHTAVSLLRDAKVPEAAVMELVGHDSVEISRRYTHVGREALSKAVDALPTL